MCMIFGVKFGRIFLQNDTKYSGYHKFFIFIIIKNIYVIHFQHN